METKTFHVDAFKNPVLAEDQRQALEAEEAQPLDMSVDAVLAAAQARTGLSDFGPRDFEARLGRLLGEVEADANVWRRYKAQFVEQCVSAAANRLRNQDFFKNHPEADDLRIDRPIIIVGLPRSGSTHLENLIGADRRLRHLPVWLGYQATPQPGETAGPDGRDPRWERAQQRWERMRANPIMEAMHEHSPDHACGENELQLPDFATYQWEWMGDVPKWRDAYFAEDQTPHYAYGRKVLKAISLQFPRDRRWMMKGNQHSEQLLALNKIYPDATIVMNHRDPLAILQSVLTMRGMYVLASQKRPDVAAHVAYWTDRIEHMLRAYIRDMDAVPQARRVDLMFQDIMADDVGSAQQVLEAAGLPATADSAEDLRDYMDHHPRGRAGRVVYDLEGNFGLDVRALRERFSFYTDLFPVKHEVK
ncbi:sulfotransferase [Phenylobacterium sp. LjRoot225]